VNDESESEASEELDFAELTTEELRDVLMTGGTIEIDMGDRMFIHVSLAAVDLWVAAGLAGGALQGLMNGLPDALHLMLPPIEHIIPRDHKSEDGQRALLQRALAARVMLVGPPTGN
jgi:hypothetical protein